MKRILFWLIASILWGGAVQAFDGDVVTEGPLQLRIQPISDVTQYDEPQDVIVELANKSDESLCVQLKLGPLVDQWYTAGPNVQRLVVGPGRSESARFRIAASQGVVSALYPVHVYASCCHQGQIIEAHAVQVFQCRFDQAELCSAQATPLRAASLANDGALPLWLLRDARVAWRFKGKAMRYMPSGWHGSCSESRAHFSIGRVHRGASRQALIVHPPWWRSAGTIFVEYRVRLPQVRPIRLYFANAIRDHGPTEPPSDGVTFRVWVGRQCVFERHTASKIWVDGQVDLSQFAGEEILLRLESHPGPRWDTTCDLAYWAEPLLVAGEQQYVRTEARRQKMCSRVRSLLAGAAPVEPNEFVFELAGKTRAAAVLGQRGLIDGAMGFGGDGKSVVFDGLCVSVTKYPLAAQPCAVGWSQVRAEREGDGVVRVIHELMLGREAFVLTGRLWAEGDGLRLKLDCDKRITDFAPGSADQRAKRIYYGHGYCIIEPKAFQADFGGHNLSTSHVGFDFEQGLSLLVATDYPPDRLEVDPQQRRYALHTHLDATMTFMPGTDGAFDCAVRYRELYDKKAAGAFAKKAGRFVFDVWGGRYTEIAEAIEQMARYGLTDSMLTIHVWQRWGYDYRLPDIYPPQPQLGTLEQMRKIAKLCDRYAILWGLHDNYIDFYPDAEGFSYEHICFTENGEPVKAWLNRWRGAQSYRFRPDRIMPFLKRNLSLIKADLVPTHYFIDVFSSIGCFDYYDRDGRFHSMLETRRCWGEAFAWIREFLGGDAPMTSEAGHDQLIGYLDGADCQFLTLSAHNGWPYIRLECTDWERVPWYDAVVHDKFSLHGVGYPGRYRLRDGHQEQRILESDDYITAEILTGHAMMIDRGGLGAGAVRKYWLAQQLVRSIAQDHITRVSFADGDIHRQIVRWGGGAVVYVNRGREDWHIDGRCLPPYGFIGRNGPIESSIEKIDGRIVEQARGGEWLYVNARPYGPDGTLPIRPAIRKLEYLGGRKFKMVVGWQVGVAVAKDLAVFAHFLDKKSSRRDKIAFQCGGAPRKPTSQWRGYIETGDEWVVEVPAQCGSGEYEIVVGLWDPAAGRRYRLIGEDDGTGRYRLGCLIVEAQAGQVCNIRCIAEDVPQDKCERWNPQGRLIDFGPVVTNGAVRCQLKQGQVVVTPLPEMGSFEVLVRLERLMEKENVVAEAVVATDIDGRKIREVGFDSGPGWVRFETHPGEFAYQIILAK